MKRNEPVMPSTDTPTWWADVQQEREDLPRRGRRPAEDWLGEDIDFVPRRRIARGTAESPTTHDAVELAGADHPLHGVFVAAPSTAVDRRRRAPAPSTGRTIEIELVSDGTGSRTIKLHADPVADAACLGVSRAIELELGADRTGGAAPSEAMVEELRHLHVADDPFSVPPPTGRRTVQITGRPGESPATSQAQRHRPRTASDRVGHRPDRVALWAVLLGAVLILLAATSSSSEAATPPVPAPAAAHVVHVAAPAAAPALAP